jgi:hypothetical protein
MRKVRFIRPSYFVWLVVPIIAWPLVAMVGLPHVIWSYDWREFEGGAVSVRHYTRCTYVGPFGVVTIHPRDGACGLLHFARASEAMR